MSRTWQRHPTNLSIDGDLQAQARQRQAENRSLWKARTGTRRSTACRCPSRDRSEDAI